ncbi:hypothetical protein K505DRAFT_417640 [Melanomma pulvis-pyrius CBS 109.77]|uniref:Uncharacterized protein n=1 Tax=Melanomma pulvis-pyrius CBS 109.77 TaxID=1314802 RepID=A0A6A6XB95_9PLEO|nr:hypothetical protein K505DRAFT_417640 [Melanomma pulvis-pyrius CBS 109.77]
MPQSTTSRISQRPVDGSAKTNPELMATGAIVTPRAAMEANGPFVASGGSSVATSFVELRSICGLPAGEVVGDVTPVFYHEDTIISAADYQPTKPSTSVFTARHMAKANSSSIPALPHSPPPPQSPSTANEARDASPPQSDLHSAFTTPSMTPTTTDMPNPSSPHLTSRPKDQNQDSLRADSAPSTSPPPEFIHSRSPTSTTSIPTTSVPSASRHLSISDIAPTTTIMPASSSPIMTKPPYTPLPTIPRRALDIFGTRPFQFIFSRRRGRKRTGEPSPRSPASRPKTQSRRSRSSPSNTPISLPPSPIRRTEPHPGTLVVFSKSRKPESAFEEEEEGEEEGELESWSSDSASSSGGRSAILGAREEYHSALYAMSRASEPETAAPVDREHGFTSRPHRHSSPAAAPVYLHGSGHACPSSPSSNISLPFSPPLFSTSKSTSANANVNVDRKGNWNPRASRKLQNIDYKERKLEQRARSMEERDRAQREGIPVHKSRSCRNSTTSTSTSTSTEDNTETENRRENDANEERETVEEGQDAPDDTTSPSPRTPSSSSSSISTPSITLFLANVRASFSARQSARPDLHAALHAHAHSATYDVFVDEAERGFLGSPLGAASAI